LSKFSGSGLGEGFNINVPLSYSPSGYGDSDYVYIIQKLFIPIAKQFSPDIVLICKSRGEDGRKKERGGKKKREDERGGSERSRDLREKDMLIIQVLDLILLWVTHLENFE
jgi:hypothetical protein